MTFGQFISDQWAHLDLPVSEETCKNKTYIVVGGNQGLGLETIRHLAACSAKKIICTVRNMEAGEAAKRDVEATTGTRNIEVWKLDLCSFDSVKAFAKRANAELDRIDAVIANASVANGAFKVSDRGHEETIAINVLSTFLLSFLLLPKLAESAKASKQLSHLVIVSSEVGFYPAGKTAWEAVQADPIKLMDDKKSSNMGHRYPLSKLIQTLLVRELAELLPVDKASVVIDCVNPGLCKTNLSRNGTFGTQVMVNTMKNIVGRTADQGSRNLLYGAVADKSCHGSFISNCVKADDRVPDWVTDSEAKRNQQRMWVDVTKEIDRIDPGCVERVLQVGKGW